MIHAVKQQIPQINAHDIYTNQPCLNKNKCMCEYDYM